MIDVHQFPLRVLIPLYPPRRQCSSLFCDSALAVDINVAAWSCDCQSLIFAHGSFLAAFAFSFLLLVWLLRAGEVVAMGTL